MSATWEDLSGPVLKRQPATNDLQESTKAFRGMDASAALKAWNFMVCKYYPGKFIGSISPG